MASVTLDMAAKMASSRDAYIVEILKLAETNPNITLVCTDNSAPGSIQDTFAKKFPDRFLEVGPCEQNAVGLSAGWALSSGKKVFCPSFSEFLSLRAGEQIYIDAAYNDAPVAFVGFSSGLTSNGGVTHNAPFDVGLLRFMPNMTIVVPSDAGMIVKLIDIAAEYEHPMYIRCSRGKEPMVYEDTDYELTLGKAITAREGSDLTFIAMGNSVYHCLKAAEMLAAEYGINARVLDMFSFKPLDEEAIIKAAKETGRIITVEDHTIIGGLGSAVCETLAACENPVCRVQVKRLGIPDKFAPNGTAEELYKYYGYDYDGIYKAAKAMLKI